MQSKRVQYKATQYNTIQKRTVQHNTVQIYRSRGEIQWAAVTTQLDIKLHVYTLLQSCAKTPLFVSEMKLFVRFTLCVFQLYELIAYKL